MNQPIDASSEDLGRVFNLKKDETLEEIAKAIFKSWFVDFDPVRAKMEGRPTGLPSEISALFPDELVDSEIGEIPKGWNVKLLGDIVVPKRGKIITKKETNEGSVPVVASGMKPSYFHNQANVKGPVVTISTSGINAGFTRLYEQDIWASDCLFISGEQSRTLYLWYLFLHLNQEEIYSMQKGSVQQHVYPSDLMRLNVCFPEPSAIWDELNMLVAPMFKRIALCEKENQILTELRDTLLPKLISGELQMPDAEAFLAEANA